MTRMPYLTELCGLLVTVDKYVTLTLLPDTEQLRLCA